MSDVLKGAESLLDIDSAPLASAFQGHLAPAAVVDAPPLEEA